MADDFIIRQIRGMGEFLGSSISGNDPQKEQYIPEENQKSESIEIDLYKRLLLQEIDLGNINGAESKLFEFLETKPNGDKEELITWFYALLKNLLPAKLEEYEFSLGEIISGEKDALGLIKGEK